MNLLKLKDAQLASLGRAVSNEAKRRSLATVNGHDSIRIIHGNEMAKRALLIAAAGQHSLLLVGPANSGKTMLRAAGLELGLAEIYEARRCPCGNWDDPLASCNCTARQIERTEAKFPVTDITVQVCRPTERERAYPGTSLAYLKHDLANKSHFTDESLDESAATLLRVSAAELPLDVVTIARTRAVARTIANLDHSEHVRTVHLCEAINRRPLRR